MQITIKELLVYYSKKSKDYSFEDIINKEQEIDELKANLKKLNANKEESNDISQDIQICKKYLNVFALIWILSSVFFIMFMIDISNVNFVTSLLCTAGVLLYNSALWGTFYHLLSERKKKSQKKLSSFQDIDKDIENVEELLNSKKCELEAMLDKVDFREYASKEEIGQIMDNMLGLTKINEQATTLILDGPTLNRQRNI